MHLSKKLFYFTIIGYSAALLWMWDFWAGINSTGNTSYMFLGKMVIDIAFIAAAFILLAGPSLFAADDDEEEEIGIHKDDLPISDSLLFGAFTLNLIGNGCYHAYLYASSTGGESAYYLIWTLAEIFGTIFCAILWRHSVIAQQRKARRARQQRENQGRDSTSSSGGSATLRRAS